MSKLYGIGKGKLYIAPWSETGIGTYRRTYNCPEFTVLPENEWDDHFTSEEGIQQKDDTVIVKAGVKLSFALDSLEFENIQLFLMGKKLGNVTIAINQEPGLYWAMKFIGADPRISSYTWIFPKVKIQPGDAFGLISESYQKLSFSGEVLSDEDQFPGRGMGYTQMMTT